MGAFSFLDQRSLSAALWQVGPSQQEGYQRCYTSETPDGDQLKVDFNFARRMARIEVAIAAERHRTYIAVIKSGVILQERELSSRRSLDLNSRMAPLARYFAHLPDAVLLQSLGGVYGLPAMPAMPVRKGPKLSELYPLQRQFRIWHWLQTRLERRRRYWESLGPWQKLWRRVPEELFDLSVGAMLLLLYGLGFLNLTELAGALGALALFSGAVDWTLRQRDPFLPKVLLLIVASFYAVYLQVQYRMWAIFL